MVDNHFSLLDIKLCFSILLVRNAKLVSFFFVRNYYLSTKTKIQYGDKTLYFPYTYIGFSAVFALVFLIFLLDLMIFTIKKVQTICLNFFIYRIFWTFQNFFKKFLIFYKKHTFLRVISPLELSSLDANLC